MVSVKIIVPEGDGIVVDLHVVPRVGESCKIGDKELGVEKVSHEILLDGSGSVVTVYLTLP